MLTFVTFRWAPPRGYRSQFRPQAVVALRDMIRRHYPHPHRFVCVCDDPSGMGDVETMALWNEFANIPNPNGRHNPSCYRRLKLFAPEAAEMFGERIVCLDLDMVAVADLTPLFDRDEDFIVWGESDYPTTQWYNGSVWMLRAGTRTKVWTEFDPKTSPLLAKRAGKKGSDQGWLSYILSNPREATWGRNDGVYSFRKHIQPMGGHLPANARLIAFHGKVDPWHWQAQRHDWVRENWGVAA